MSWKFWKTSYYGTSAERSTLANIMRIIFGLIALYLIAALAVGAWWSRKPDLFDVTANAQAYAAEDGVEKIVTGYTTAAALHQIANTLLQKPGGYLSNDRFPPGVWLDNTPNWEFGALTQIRDMSRAMRIDFARSQSQSAEDKDLQNAEGFFFFDNSSWMFPQTESEYTEGNKLVRSYAKRLTSEADSDGQFYARADNLQNWLEGVESRLGNLSQQLSASVGKGMPTPLSRPQQMQKMTSKHPGQNSTTSSLKLAVTPGHSSIYCERPRSTSKMCSKIKTP